MPAGRRSKGWSRIELDTRRAGLDAATGPISYSSAATGHVCRQPQVLSLSDTGLVAVDPQTGKRLWHYDANATGIWRVVQPRQMGDAQVLVGSEDLGCATARHRA